jgi:hypothetical protein
MLSPIQVKSDPRGDSNKVLLVWESFNPDPLDRSVENCTTIIAVLDGGRGVPDPMDEGTLTEWTSYQAAFNATRDDQDVRVAYTRYRGNKLNEEVARAMFSRLHRVHYRS